MKRKKWTEEEESTLISKYSELMSSGTLSKLKTREKKFDPIAQHVNATHHLQDPLSFPFRWSWRDVSIKIQNMRHQYLGVKQKIRIPSSPHFNWSDGLNHWHNFLNYKHVFGDIDLVDLKDPTTPNNTQIPMLADRDVFSYDGFIDSDVLGLGLGIDCDDDDLDGNDGDDDDDDDGVEGEDEEEEDEGGGGDGDDLGGLVRGTKRAKRGEGSDLGGQFSELREMAERREERRREREFVKEEEEAREKSDRDKRRKEREEGASNREMEWEERERMWARRSFERRTRVEREFEEEKRRRMKMEEKREEDEMEWRERMLGMQIEHDKQMMQMYADACNGQMQVLGVLVRLVCQLFGTGGDGLGGGMGAIQQVLQHPENLVGDNEKTDGNSDTHFM